VTRATRRRVLFLFPFPSLGGSGGAQRVFSTLLRYLERERFELHLALLHPGEAEDDDIPDDVTVHDLGVKRARYTIPRIARLVRRLKPDTVLSTLGHMNIALLLSKWMLPRKTRILIRESTTPSVFLRQGTGYPRTWTVLYRWLYKRADMVIALSDTMMKDLAENFRVPPEKLVRIYNPVDVEMIRRLAQLQGSPFSSAGPNLVAAGRFVRDKGFDLLIDALPQVLACFPQARLALPGDGPLECELKEQVRSLGIGDAVTFPGMQKNPWRYFHHAHLVVVPSRFDGLANVPLEALALGTPVIATDCPGAIREIRASDERVVLVSPDDPTALAEGIVSALRQPKKVSRE
jgi:glycosyltransferase involved in cell wall biosynthesis